MALSVTISAASTTIARLAGTYSGGSALYAYKRRLIISGLGPSQRTVDSSNTGGPTSSFTATISGGLVPGGVYTWTAALAETTNGTVWVPTGITVSGTLVMPPDTVSGVAKIGAATANYYPYIFNGTTWVRYAPYIYTTGGWKIGVE